MRLTPHSLSLFALLLLGGCFIKTAGDDSGVNDGSDGGSDGGSGGDGGDGGDGGSGGSINCDRTPNTPDPDGSCVTGALSCGDSIVVDMAGVGANTIDGAEYSSGAWACWPANISDYQGGERFFEFSHPGRSDAPAMVTVTLDSPCGDLDLFAFRWDSNSCPSGGASPFECEAAVGSGGGSVDIWNNEPRDYLIGVEGPRGVEVPFRLTITCEQ